LPLFTRYIPVIPACLIKIDRDMNPIRDKNGFCVRCDFNEKGLLVGIIGNSSKSEYSGYANNNDATNKKIIENLFKKGQKGFNSGIN
jgi:hypothetical protein